MLIGAVLVSEADVVPTTFGLIEGLPVPGVASVDEAPSGVVLAGCSTLAANSLSLCRRIKRRDWPAADAAVEGVDAAAGVEVGAGVAVMVATGSGVKAGTGVTVAAGGLGLVVAFEGCEVAVEAAVAAA